MKVASSGVHKKRIRRHVPVQSRLTRAEPTVSDPGGRNRIVGKENWRVRIIGCAAPDRGLPLRCNDNVVDNSGLRIKTVGENSGSLRTRVRINRVVDEEGSARAGGHHPVHSTTTT